MTDIKLATPKQVGFCRTLFRKSKMYYNCLDDQKLSVEVFKRTGFNLNELSQTEAQRIIGMLSGVAKRQRPYIPHWQKRTF